jgi:hypothetical protein
MKTIVGAALLTLTTFAALPVQGGEPTYTLTDLGTAPRGVWPFGDEVLKMGINKEGDVAGLSLPSQAAPSTCARKRYSTVTAALRWSTLTWSSVRASGLQGPMGAPSTTRE